MISIVPLLTALAAMLAVVLVVYALVAGGGRERRELLDNLQRGMFDPDSERASRPTGRSGLARVAYALTPAGSVKLLDTLLTRVGRPAAWPLDRVVPAKLLAAVLAAGVGLLLVLNSPTPMIIALAVGMTGLAWFVPELLLHSRGSERSDRIARQLPDMMDQMTIAMEAGLGFDAAMARTAQNGDGALAEELRRTMQDLQVGSPRRYAYEGLATRTNVPDVRRFVRAINQGEKHGISIADVLRTQAEEQRLKRRQRAEERAMQIPVKVIFPLMLCILPVLFIVLLGPSVINVMTAFTG